MVTFAAADPGTPEEDWIRSGVRERAAALDIGAIRRLVVLAAHPDDESLAAGGLIHAVAASGRPVVLIIASSGEASHPGSATGLAERREREVEAAAAALAPAARVELLRLPDGGLRDHRPGLVAAVRRSVRAGDTVVAPWRGDGHPDHEVVGAVAADAVDEAGASLLEAPIWAWHWGDPGAPGWPPAVRFDLSAPAVAAKARAIAAHGSQVAPLAPGEAALLTPTTLAHFTGPAELFFPSGVVPVDFDAMYGASDDPWGFADRWYERRKRALTVAALPDERYRSVLEIGCSTGLLTEALADRSDAVLGIDVADRAVELAQRRFATRSDVQVERRRVPAEWPDGRFDLVVLSETGFYLDRRELAVLADRVRAALEPGGVVLLCHWRPHVVGLDLSGDAVHELLRARLGLARLVEHVEDDFRLEVLQAEPALSVAARTGLR